MELRQAAGVWHAQMAPAIQGSSVPRLGLVLYVGPALLASRVTAHVTGVDVCVVGTGHASPESRATTWVVVSAVGPAHLG